MLHFNFHLLICDILELPRYSTAESGWDEQTAYRNEPVDIWKVDQIDRYVQNTGDSCSFYIDFWI